MIALLKLRWFQAFRILQEIGLVLLLVALFACASFIIAVFIGLRDSSPQDILLLAALLIVVVDVWRKDKHFLLLLFGGRFRAKAYLSVEYGLLVLPFLGVLLSKASFLYILYLLVLIPSISFLLPYRLRFARQVSKQNLSFIPLRFFELKFFIEKRKVSMLFIVLLLFLGMFHISAWILGMVFLAAALTEVFKYLEPRMMIQEPFKSRLWHYVLFFQGILLFPTIANLLVFPGYYLVYLYGWLCVGIALILVFSFKYAHYTGWQSVLFSSNFPATYIILSLLPGFVLLTAGAAYYYYIKALKNKAYAGT